MSVMTKPKDDQRCQRCFERDKIPGPGTRFCSECYGKCQGCSGPASYCERGKYFRKYCAACKSIHERRDSCSLCGGPLDGAHISYCKACFSTYYRERRARDPEKHRYAEWRYEIQKSYGITPDEWNAMFVRQGGRCAACGSTSTTGRDRFDVDHNHDSGAVRGLLCRGCNMAIGYVHEDVGRLQGIIDYLTRTEPSRSLR